MLTAVLLMLGAGDVLDRHECGRCHEYAQKPVLASGLRCAECHVAISSGKATNAEGRYTKEAWARFVKRTSEHYVNVPPLEGLGRLRTSWLVSFLEAPYHLRPRLSESMIRNRLTAAERAEVAARLGTQADEQAPAAPAAERLAEGAKRFQTLGCGTCHAATPASRERPLALAPDLAHTRDRMNHAAVVAYVKAPAAMNPGTEMKYGARTDDEARLLADYVFFGGLTPAQRKVPKLPAVDILAAVPTYDEVEARVFRKVCWHCHSNPDFADGNGGPGMSGGFGFPARGLSFATFAEVMNGSRDDQGQQQSIFRKGATGEPVLLEVLRARYGEEAGRAGPGGPIGMPLGLPALAPEDFSLVERWVKGGRRPPKKQSAPAAPMSER